MTSLPRTATTELRNPDSNSLDAMDTTTLLTLINTEDHLVAPAVKKALAPIAAAVDQTANALQQGGRLIYLGAGTSGRLGVLDAAECPPTFGTDPETIIGLIAGGNQAMFRSQEGAEDSLILAREQLSQIGIGPKDVVVGIAASGRTPYVIAGLDYARECKATTIAIACNLGVSLSRHADIAIEVDCGPEVLTGSTRLKAGTAQKMILNMISTAAMVRTGRVLSNLMVDVQASNEKLRDRAVRIICAATECTEQGARDALAAANGHAKTAIVMVLCGLDAPTARARLAEAKGFVREALSGTQLPSQTEGRAQRKTPPADKKPSS